MSECPKCGGPPPLANDRCLQDGCPVNTGEGWRIDMAEACERRAKVVEAEGLRTQAEYRGLEYMPLGLAAAQRLGCRDALREFAKILRGQGE